MTAPQQTVQLQSGDSVEIRWIDADADDQATTDVVAVDLDTAAEILIVDDALEMDGVEQSFTWQPPAQLMGTYRIEARTTDGSSTAVARAAGQVLVGMPRLLSPGAQAVLSGGRPERLALSDDATFTLGGWFSSFEPLVVAEGEANEAMESSASQDVFLARYSSDGVFRTLARTHFSSITDGEQGLVGLIDLTPMGEHTLATLGLFGGQVTLGLGEPQEATYESEDNFFDAKVIFACYDRDGRVVWSSDPIQGYQSAGETWLAEWEQGFWMLSYSDDSTVFGAGQPNETALGYEELVLLRWDRNGLLVEARPFADVDANGGFDDPLMVAGTTGSTVLCGFYGDVTFDPGGPNETSFQVTSADEDDVVVVRHDNDGGFVWARQIALTAEDTYIETLDAHQFEDGALAFLLEYSVGNLDEQVTFGPGEANETTVTLQASADGSFLVFFAPDGTFLWHMQIEDVDSEHVQLFAYGDDAMGLLGDFNDELSLRDTMGQEVTLFEDVTPGLGALFLARIGRDGGLRFARNDGGQNGGRLSGTAMGVPGLNGGQVLWAGRTSFNEMELGTNETPIQIPGDRGFLAVFGPNGEVGPSGGGDTF